MEYADGQIVMGHDGGRPFGYRFFRGPCPRCQKSCALSFTDAGFIWFRRHNPCGAFRVPRGDYELRQKTRKV
jgi:hypothetical protein